jgi:hypothetical protein
MAINLLPVLGAGIGALQQSKLEKAVDGTKTYTRPKTIFGKLIGGVSGRTAAYNLQQDVKQTDLTQAAANSLQPQNFNTDPNIRTSFPVTGDVQFGTQAKSRPWLPYAIVGALVAIFYFMRGKKGRKGRY